LVNKRFNLILEKLYLELTFQTDFIITRFLYAVPSSSFEIYALSVYFE